MHVHDPMQRYGSGGSPDCKFLGILGDIWEVWDGEDKQIKSQSFSHFTSLYLGQLQELLSHHNTGNTQGAINEAIDFMSVSMNFLRWSGLSVHEIYDAIKNRIDTRYRGKVRAILDRDAGRYGA
ncbi:hypothetical protein LCGC14_0988110 [marine sediment metagenome]|uniref:Uncharacterized protein n=1 Tax=marine sediment metagenome TaxID=412755 RepID=A0A0F9RD97_9ZZZZ